MLPADVEDLPSTEGEVTAVAHLFGPDGSCPDWTRRHGD